MYKGSSRPAFLRRYAKDPWTQKMVIIHPNPAAAKMRTTRKAGNQEALNLLFPGFQFSLDVPFCIPLNRYKKMENDGTEGWS